MLSRLQGRIFSLLYLFTCDGANDGHRNRDGLNDWIYDQAQKENAEGGKQNAEEGRESS